MYERYTLTTLINEYLLEVRPLLVTGCYIVIFLHQNTTGIHAISFLIGHFAESPGGISVVIIELTQSLYIPPEYA